MKNITKLVFIILLSYQSLFSDEKSISIQLNWKYQFEYAGFIIAKEKGFYKNAGFNVQLKEFQNTTNTLDDVIKNRVEFGITDSLLMIERQNNDVILLANYLKQSPLVIAANSSIKHPKDLENKSFMSSRERIINTPLDFMFKHLGVIYNNITFKENTYDVHELINNKIDAMEVYKSNEVYLLQKSNINYNLLEPKDYGFNSGAINMFTSKDTINKLGKEKVSLFVEATNKGWKYALENIDETINLIYTKYNGTLNKSKDALLFEANEIKKLFLLNQYEIGQINKDELYRWYDILNNYGLIKNTDRYEEFLFNQEWKEKTYTKEQISIFIVSVIFLVLIMLIVLYFSKSKAKLLEEKNKQIQAQQKAFKTLFDDASDGLSIMKEGRFLDCNKAFIKLFGFKAKEDVLVFDFNSLMPKYQPNGENSVDEYEKMIQHTLKNGSSNFEFMHKKLDNKEFWLEITLTNMILNNDNVIHTVWRDISQRKELEQTLKVKDFQLLESKKLASLGEMIGNIAHQWRQPLSAVSMILSSMKVEKELGILNDESIDKKINDTLMYTNQLSTTIETFRNFIKGDKTKKLTSIQDVINKTLDIISSTLRNNNINIYHNMSEVKSIKINIVSDELTQVIMNILNNAKDVLNSNENIKNKWIKININEDKDFAVISIEDNGGGIPENIISHIFDPYFTTKHKSQGTGLGLHMSYRIITESLNGSLYVENSEYGAKFFIKLPL